MIDPENARSNPGRKGIDWYGGPGVSNIQTDNGNKLIQSEDPRDKNTYDRMKTEQGGHPDKNTDGKR